MKAVAGRWYYIDSDLQLAPEELPALVAEYDRGFDLVTGYRKNRKDSLFRIIPSTSGEYHYAARFAQQNSRLRLHLQDIQCAYRCGPFSSDRIMLLSFVEVISKIDRIAEVPVTHYPQGDTAVRAGRSQAAEIQH